MNTTPLDGDGTKPERPTSARTVIAVGILAARALMIGRRPRPADLLDALAVEPAAGTEEPDLAVVCDVLAAGATTLLGASALLSAPHVAGAAAAGAASDSALAVERLGDALQLGDAADAPTLLDALADGLDALACPDDAPIVACPGTDAACGRIVPFGETVCRECGSGRRQA